MARPIILGCLLLVLALPVAAQQRFVVGVVLDGPSDRFAAQQQQYVDELLVLTAGEFDVRIKRFSGEWTNVSISAAIERAYDDDEVDLVMVTGFLANQLAATRPAFSKPTFLPLIIDTALIAGKPGVGQSGVRNLNYLSMYADFADDLDTLRRITPYQNLALLLDAGLSSAIPKLRERAFATTEARGVELIEVAHDGVDHDLMKRVPAETDAVFLAGLPRMPSEDFDRLIAAINAAGLPSYSFVGVADVERGLLVTNSEPRDVERQARLNALNMQAVMLGARAEDQPTASQLKEQLTINMATARQIALSPDFDVLEDAVLLNQDVEVTGDEYGLVEIARLALSENQDLRAETFRMRAGNTEIARARAGLLPQIGVATSYSLRRQSAFVESGMFAERSRDAALSLDQLLYSDQTVGNLSIQKSLQRSRIAALEEFRLDVVQAASIAYYSVLNARSQLDVQADNQRITRANLELAEDRVRLGISTRADVYRWQAEEARAQIRVVNARAALDQVWETLNRILHLPQGQRIALRDASVDEVMSRDEFETMVRSQADYARFSQFYIEQALGRAPELQQLDGQIAAKRREVVSQRRSFWLPEFTIGGRYTDNLGQSGLGAGLQAGQDLNDWTVGVQATLPLFSGGLRRANLSRAGYELQQLMALRTSTEERVEEQVRNLLYAAQAAYQQIDLSATAAEASRKNLELVSDAYARGTVSVIELLDAQDTSLAASATAADSLYNFLITIIDAQRAAGSYEFLLPDDEKNAISSELRMRITGTNE